MRRREYKYIGYGKVELVCLHCGNPFQSRRRDAQFCGVNCRKANSRRADKIRHCADAAIEQINSLRAYINQYPDLAPEGSTELRRVLEALNVT